jgi:lysophospholipase L1-like esterase
MKLHLRFLFALSLVALTTNSLFAQTAAPAKPAEKPAAAPAKPNPVDDAPTTQPVNRDGARHQLINSRAKPGEVDLLFIGDSITQGWEGAGKEAWEKYFGKRKPMNAGIGGDRTQHVLWRLENGNIKGITPKAAVIMIGTNNSGRNTSEEIAAGVTAIVNKLRKELPETKILLLATFPRGADKNDARRKVNEGSNAIVAKLADGKSIFFLDIGDKLMNADGTISRDIMPDLLHLSPTGYDIWGSAIDAKVGELLGEKS